MASSYACQCSLTLLLLFIAACPPQTHARESRFFSKVSRSQTPVTQNISPTSSPSVPVTEAKTEHGYGLLGAEETYEYPPTTTNPTKSETRKFQYVEPSGVGGYRYEAGESDTRFMENGKLMEEDDGHESYYSQVSEDKGKRVMTGTWPSQKGTQFYQLGEKENGRYESNVESYKTNKYGNEEYRLPAYRRGKRQGMSDTRYMANGRYFYDVHNHEKPKKNDEYYKKASYEEGYDGKYDKESERSSGYDFRSTPNNFPKYEFDSMEEYEKYEQARSHQQEYEP